MAEVDIRYLPRHLLYQVERGEWGGGGFALMAPGFVNVGAYPGIAGDCVPFGEAPLELRLAYLRSQGVSHG